MTQSRFTGVTQHIALIWPLTGLILGLHFLPMASIFRVRPYYATGLLSMAVSVAALTLRGDAQMLLTGCGIGAVLWGTSLYPASQADRLAREVCV